MAERNSSRDVILKKKQVMKRILNVGLLLAGFLTSIVSFGQKPAVVADGKPGWHRIAGLEANFNKDNESVHIMGNDEFQALRFRVEDAPIHIERMQVFYESGDMEDVDVKSAMKTEKTSRTFQLKHAGRDISKIAFTYHTVDNDKSKKAELEIYGLKTNATASDSYDKKVDEAEGEVKETREEAREEARETESDLERAAEKTGDEVSEAAAKTAAEIDDKRHDTKVGPDGQVIYISDNDRFYYINEEGKKVFVTEVELKDK
jgi:flagellar biosynthesis GTPase FlhF